jgi:hypothetical protein
MKGLRAVREDIAAGFLLRAWEAVSTEVLDETWSINEDFGQCEREDKTNKSHFITVILMTFVSFVSQFDASGFYLHFLLHFCFVSPFPVIPASLLSGALLLFLHFFFLFFRSSLPFLSSLRLVHFL